MVRFASLFALWKYTEIRGDAGHWTVEGSVSAVMDMGAGSRRFRFLLPFFIDIVCRVIAYSDAIVGNKIIRASSVQGEAFLHINYFTTIGTEVFSLKGLLQYLCYILFGGQYCSIYHCTHINTLYILKVKKHFNSVYAMIVYKFYGMEYISSRRKRRILHITQCIIDYPFMVTPSTIIPINLHKCVWCKVLFQRNLFINARRKNLVWCHFTHIIKG